MNLYTLDGHTVVPCPDTLEWARKLDHRFIGDGPPLVFETMMWINKPPCSREFLELQERCSTWEEAEAQHAAVIAKLRSDNPQDEEEEEED